MRNDTTKHDWNGQPQRQVDANGDAHHRHLESNQSDSDGCTQHDHLDVQIAPERTLDDGADEFSLWSKEGFRTGRVAGERVHLTCCLRNSKRIVKQRQDGANHHCAGQDTDDFCNLLALWRGTKHVAGLEILHDVARNSGARGHNGCDEKRRKHQVLFGHSEHQVPDDVHQPHGEQQRGDGHARNRRV